MSKITFNGRWKEELEATSAEGKLIFEFTMGKEHVYFPDEERWRNCVPVWAKDKWSAYAAGCKKWCDDNRIPMSVVADAHVYEEKNSC